MGNSTNRRSFLKASAVAGAGFWVATSESRAQSRSPNEKINVACIGVGGKGDSDSNDAGRLGNVVAICDTRDSALENKKKKFGKARAFNDFRKMLDEMGKDIDAVTVSTADHCHAIASLSAMQLKKHVFCQKPLTHNAYEARVMVQAAKKYGVCTQMGNQGTSTDGLRKAVETVWSGMIGPVREVHVWTNRSVGVWPQGGAAVIDLPAVQAALRGQGDPQTTAKDVHWDLFLGPAPERPYQPNYQPFRWRGWWDFGTGALGDMACHTANMAFMACKLASPLSLVAEVSELNPQTYPLWSVLQYEFPEREGLPPLQWNWYDGGTMKPGWATKKIEALAKGQKVPLSGSLLVGEKATLYSPNDYGEDWVIIPADGKEVIQDKDVKVEQKLPRAHGQHMEEWFKAMKANKPELAMSNFDYAGRLTETVVLGCVAQRFPGQKLEWDGKAMKFTNFDKANRYVSREYRKGFEVKFDLT